MERHGLSARWRRNSAIKAVPRPAPVGSGEIESAHRYVAQQRLKRPGAWWRVEHAEYMLALRLFVVDFRRFAMTDERPQCHLETPVSERVLLRITRINGDWDAYWKNLGRTAVPVANQNSPQNSQKSRSLIAPLWIAPLRPLMLDAKTRRFVRGQSGRRRFCHGGRRHGGARQRERIAGPATSQTLACADAPCPGTGKSHTWPTARAAGPHREGDEPKPMTHGREKSGPAIVAAKPTNEAGRPAEEPGKPRAGPRRTRKGGTLRTEPGRRVPRPQPPMASRD